mgnify:FL=1
MGFANYFTRKDESIYDTFNLIVGRNPLILMFFFIVTTILNLFNYNPFYFLEGLEKLERLVILFLCYLIVLPLFILIFPTSEIKKVTLDESQLKYYYRLNAILLFSIVFLSMLLSLHKDGLIL